MSRMFEKRTVMISGGLGDIGQATALAFAAEGANVSVCDIAVPEKSKLLKENTEQYKVGFLYRQVDISDADAVNKWISETESELGVPTMIIANAAIVHYGSIMDVKPEQWTRELNVNVDGAFYFAQGGAARMLHHQLEGRIVFIGSWAGHAPHIHIPAYCVSKAALRMLCQLMALELAPQGIIVNELAPGFVDAGLSGRSFEKDANVREQARVKVPVQKLITADEVASMVVFLCNPANQHMAGATLLMDGGLSLRR